MQSALAQLAHKANGADCGRNYLIPTSAKLAETMATCLIIAEMRGITTETCLSQGSGKSARFEFRQFRPGNA
jgi:hypothetical protein